MAKHLFLALLIAAAGCTTTSSSDDVGDNGSGSGSGSGSDPGDPPAEYTHDPGLEGAPFSLTDPSCTATADHIECQSVVYSVVDGLELHLDLYAPLAARTQKVPVIVYVHGGGWLSGSYHQIGLDLDQYLAQGYAVVGVEYRLTASPYPTKTGFQFPDNLKDVKTAIRWLRTKASGFIDDQRIVAYGFSAGAHLVAMLDTTGYVPEFEGRGDPRVPSTISAAVGLSTPTDFHLFLPENPALDSACPPQDPPAPGGTPSIGVALLLGVDEANFQSLTDSPKLDWVSPLTYLDGGYESDPPMLMFAGTCDQVVPYQGALHMRDLAYEKAAPVEVFISDTATHGGTLGAPGAREKLDTFLTLYLHQ